MAAEFTLEGSTVPDIQKAINQGLLSSKKLVQMYLDRIAAYDGSPGLNLNSIIALNPNALAQAAALDPRPPCWRSRCTPPLHRAWPS